MSWSLHQPQGIISLDPKRDASAKSLLHGRGLSPGHLGKTPASGLVLQDLPRTDRKIKPLQHSLSEILEPLPAAPRQTGSKTLNRVPNVLESPSSAPKKKKKENSPTLPSRPRLNWRWLPQLQCRQDQRPARSVGGQGSLDSPDPLSSVCPDRERWKREREREEESGRYRRGESAKLLVCRLACAAIRRAPAGSGNRG